MPDPSVPPTPPVPLSALLAREDLGLRPIAAVPDPAAVQIHWAHASEMADPYPYLLGGELLLSAGVHIPSPDTPGAYFGTYVSRIVAAGGAALGFGLAPVHDTVPPALVAACETHGLPLLEVPPRTPFSAVARAVWQLMAQARLSELRRVTEAQQSLAAAASRPDPVPSVLRQLSQRVGGWAALYGPDGTELSAAGRGPRPEARKALAELTGVVRPSDRAAGSRAAGAAPTAGEAAPRKRGQANPTPPPATGAAAPAPASATDTVAGTHLAAYALGPTPGFVLGVATTHTDQATHTIASVAAVLLTLLTGEQQTGTGAARTSALVRLLLGAGPKDVAPLLGPGAHVVVHARPDPHTTPDPLTASALGTALGSPLVDLAPETDVVRVLVPADREITPQPGWTLGVSDPVSPDQWPAADTRAARALARAKATRTPLVRHGARTGLAHLVPDDAAEAYARTLLQPIADTPALVETLRTWLSLHGSWDRTAVALAVHRNTVRQRIARCAALLGTDLDDPDVRMELWFALRQ
ncbi:helix-turn-helix domain-containing protein [Streptomyces sp. NPDC054829]